LDKKVGESNWPSDSVTGLKKTLDATFFRRLAEGVLDEEDLIFRAQELADFIVAHLREHNLTDIPVVVVGYSNGANIAASLLLLHPGVLSGAILFGRCCR